MEGRKEEVLARCRRKPDSKRPNSSGARGKAPDKAGTHFDKTGRAYIVNADTGKAILLDNTPSTDTTAPATSEFAGLVADRLSDVEFSFATMTQDLVTSVD